MGRSPTDANLVAKLDEVNELYNIAEKISKKLRQNLKNIDGLFLIEKRKLNSDGSPATTDNGTPIYEFHSPNNLAGDPMDETYRTEQKDKLIVNIDALQSIIKDNLIQMSDSIT